MMVYRNKSKSRRGTAMIELAVLLPFMVPLLLGVWEVGRLIEVQQILNNAVREGGRFTATGSSSTAEVKSVVLDYLKHNNIPIDMATVEVVNETDPARADPRDANQLDRFRITVELPFDSVRWILLDQITNTTTLTSTAAWYSMRDIPITVNLNVPLE